jgi:RNA polymerase sigma-70 factor (ECF subfamily)
MHAMKMVQPVMTATTTAEFDAFYGEQYQPLMRLAWALAGSKAVAEDLVQETMLRVYRHWSKVAGYDRPGAWARRVLLNLATSRGRRLTVEARGLARLGKPRDTTPPPDDEDIWTLVRALPKREAQVVALFYLEDMTVDEIATLLESPAGTIKSLLHRARKSLAEQLGEVES